MDNVSKIFGFLSNYFGGFTYCVLYFLISNWKCSLALQGSGVFLLISLWTNVDPFFLMFHLIITHWILKSLNIKVVLIALAIFRIYIITYEKKLEKKWSYRDEKIALKNGDNK